MFRDWLKEMFVWYPNSLHKRTWWTILPSPTLLPSLYWSLLLHKPDNIAVFCYNNFIIGVAISWLERASSRIKHVMLYPSNRTNFPDFENRFYDSKWVNRVTKPFSIERGIHRSKTNNHFHRVQVLATSNSSIFIPMFFSLRTRISFVRANKFNHSLNFLRFHGKALNHGRICFWGRTFTHTIGKHTPIGCYSNLETKIVVYRKRKEQLDRVQPRCPPPLSEAG